MKQFDVFLSYKSEDHKWVENLRTSLHARGVRVWLDKDQIRPGDRFVSALERGLETSRSVALVVTPGSLSSGWVEDEYSRALSLLNQGQLQLIPLLLRDAQLPGFLSNRQHVDFRDGQGFDQQVDRLVFPGITGKDVVWYPVYGRYRSPRWERLTSVAKTLGIEVAEGEDIHRSASFVSSILNDKRKRLVLVFDIFEERPAEPDIWRNEVSEYVETIFGYRDETKGQANEIVFMLYQQANAWDRVSSVAALDPGHVSRLKHYFTLHQDIAEDAEMGRELRAIWTRIQRDLMSTEIAQSLTTRSTQVATHHSRGDARTVVTFGPPPARPRLQSSAPAETEWVAMAARFGCWVSGEPAFDRACRAAGMGPELFWAATSATDRWFAAISTAAAYSVLSQLLAAAEETLPAVLRRDVTTRTSTPSEWDREALYQYRLDAGLRVNEADWIGHRALRHLWGSHAPAFPELDRYLGQSVPDGSDSRGHATAAPDGAPSRIEVGLAADHLVAWARDNQEYLVAWIREHAAQLASSPGRFVVLAAAIAWWDEGRRAMVQHARALSASLVEDVSKRAIDGALSTLSALDQLLQEAGTPWWNEEELLPSVQLAQRADRLSSIAALLEAVDERRPEIFLARLDHTYTNRQAVTALARALRRLCIGGARIEPRDPVIAIALRASLPSATAAVVRVATNDRQARSWWLDFLSPPLTAAQRDGLSTVCRNDPVRAERDRARRWLCTSPDPLGVWTELEARLQPAWLEDLTPFELRLLIGLTGKAAPRGANRDRWTRLQERLANDALPEDPLT